MKERKKEKTARLSSSRSTAGWSEGATEANDFSFSMDTREEQEGGSRGWRWSNSNFGNDFWRTFNWVSLLAWLSESSRGSSVFGGW